MSTYLRKNTVRPVPQTERENSRQVKNNAGGFVYETSEEDAVRRFIVLGSEGGTYYAGEGELTKENTLLLQNFARKNAKRLVDIIVEISTEGRAPKQSPGLFALAIAASVPEDAKDRQYALGVLQSVARTASTLFEFVSYVTLFRGWGNALRRAVADWYLDKDYEELGNQVAKYRSRHGFTHRDLLRLAHPKAGITAKSDLFKALVSGNTDGNLPDSYKDYLRASVATVSDFKDAVKRGVSWEYFPTELHKLPEFWEALMDAEAIPFQALVRNLPRLTALDVDDHPYILETLNKGNKFAHPINLAIAGKAYGLGRNRNLEWSPNHHISYALSNALENSFKNAEPTGKRIMLAVDVSGSMGWSGYDANSSLTPREMAAIMALGFLKTEKNAVVTAFSHGLTKLDITSRSGFQNALSKMNELSYMFSRTDCSLPMERSADFGDNFDAFVVLTDNETWSGSVHPMTALKKYRKRSGIADAKLVVAGFTATNFTIADPKDKFTMDVVGTDSAIPKLVSDFIAGRV